MWRNKQQMPEGGKGTDVRIIHKSLYQFWVRLFSQVLLPRRRPFGGDPGLLLHLLILEVDVLLLSVRGQDGGGLADLHPGVECCDLHVVLLVRASDNPAPDVLIASGQLQLLKCEANNNRPPDKLSKAVSRSMIIAHFIYYSGQCWLEHAKDFYLEMSGPPARSWPGVTRVGTGGRASRPSLKRAVTCDGR